MSSSDGGGSTQCDPRAGEPAESGTPGLSPDDDPVRLSPPADPWLADAPTSVLGDATPPADTTPFAASPAPATAHSEAPRRRTIRWAAVVLAACVLLLAGVLAIDPFGSGDDGDGDVLGSDPSIGVTVAPTPTGNGQEPLAPVDGVPAADVTTGRQPAATASSAGAAPPGASADAGAPEVVYEVTASGSRNTGSVSYTDQDGEIIRRNGIPLPWRVTFPMGAQRKPLVLIAQRKGGGDAGPVTCTITVNGKVLAETTATGKYAAPQCSGSG